MAALEIDPNSKIIPCKTFDECFLKASSETNSRIVIPESNRITGNIGIEYLIFKYRLNIYAEHFQKIEHNLLGLPATKISEIKDVYPEPINNWTVDITYHNVDRLIGKVIEREIIKKALVNLNNATSQDVEALIIRAEKKEQESNQIVEFTREIKKNSISY